MQTTNTEDYLLHTEHPLQIRNGDTEFKLHPRLLQDCFVIGDLQLSRLLMMNDSRYPWFILVPKRQELKEIYQLAPTDRHILISESCCLAETMQAIYKPDKLNIASIGNLVPQLHIHHVARYQADMAWPAPVWGKFPAAAYAQAQADERIAELKAMLGGCLIGD